MNSTRLLVSLVLIALVADLFILISGMANLTLLPGKRLPNPFTSFGELDPAVSPPGTTWGEDTLRILIQAIFALGATTILLFVIFSREHRKQFAVIFLVLLLLFLILVYIGEIPQSDQSAVLETNMGTEIGAAPPVEQVRVDIPQVEPTNWQVILITLGSSLLLTLFAVVFFVKIYPLIRSRSVDKESVLNKLGKSAGLAARRIISGDDPRAAILLCYHEMTQIMSNHEQVQNYSFLTPREFALRLHQGGMKDDDVDRLTAIFEAVRYGGRSGAEFVNEAMSCLQSIHRTYVLEEPA